MTQTSFDLQSFTRAWREGDLEKILSHYADDVEFSYPLVGGPLHGKDELRKQLQPMTRAFTDLNLQLDTALLSANDQIGGMWRATGRFANDYAIPGGRTIPSTGRDVDIPFAAFATLDREGRIVREQMLFDTAAVVKQLDVDVGVLARA